MRLINADELIEKVKVDGLGFRTYYAILNTPTVDAVSIEWLEEKYKDLEYSYSFGATDELKSRMDGIRYAINLWRKENEIDWCR